MRSLKFAVFSLLLVALAACGEPPKNPVAQPTNTPSTVNLSRDLQTLQTLVNEARAVERSCGAETFKAATPLTLNTKLSTAAQKHSEDMELAGKLDHVTPEGAIHYTVGTTFDNRVKQEGYVFKTAGENIARGFNSPEAVMEAWLASPGHCRNIMKPTYTEIGLGKSGSYWTQEFAAPQP
jgi:uncharacterized protein YkwD